MKIFKVLRDWWPIWVPVVIFLIVLLILWYVDPSWIPEDFWEARNMTEVR